MIHVEKFRIERSFAGMNLHIRLHESQWDRFGRLHLFWVSERMVMYVKETPVWRDKSHKWFCIHPYDNHLKTVMHDIWGELP